MRTHQQNFIIHLKYFWFAITKRHILLQFIVRLFYDRCFIHCKACFGFLPLGWLSSAGGLVVSVFSWLFTAWHTCCNLKLVRSLSRLIIVLEVAIKKRNCIQWKLRYLDWKNSHAVSF